MIGPNVIDPVCHYDPDNHRFVVAITTLHVDADGDFNGKNTIDLAVSNTGNPTGTWTVYHVPAQNDGTDGTPNHGCTLDGTTPGPCFQDYPHIGADKNGVYVTTNEYDLFGPSFNAAQIFAFSKAQLAAHPASIAVDAGREPRASTARRASRSGPPPRRPGTTAADANGTEYFLSTIAGDGSETGNPTGTARRIGLWAVTNTSSLNSGVARARDHEPADQQPDLRVPAEVEPEGRATSRSATASTTRRSPRRSGRAAGSSSSSTSRRTTRSSRHPIRTTPGCSRRGTRTARSGAASGHGASRVGGELKAGIAWFAVSPKINGAGKVEGQVKKQGYLALADNNLTYPAIAMGAERQGRDRVHGPGRRPTTRAPATPRSTRAARSVRSTSPAPGSVPTTGSRATRRSSAIRRGRAGATTARQSPTGASIWIASEYIAQTCTLNQYLTGAIGSCGGTAHLARELGHASEQARSLALDSLDRRGGYAHVSAPPLGLSGRPATAIPRYN